MTTSATALINIAKTALGLDDETYRAKLFNITGETSLRKMTETQLNQVIKVFENEGFRRGPKKSRNDGRRELTGPYLRKLRALWISGYNLGIIRNRDDRAMIAWIEEQTGIPDTRFLRAHADAKAAIEGLKGWLQRDAGVGFGSTGGQAWLASEPAKVAWAQWKILHPDASLIVRKGFDEEVAKILKGKFVWLGDMKPREWQAVMNAFGIRVRAARRAVK